MRPWNKITTAVLLAVTTRLFVTGLSSRKVALLESHHYGSFNSREQHQAALAKFYRQNGSRLPRIKPGEVQYSLRQPLEANDHNDNSTPIASLRMCHRYEGATKNADPPPTWIFLRALCVATEYRRQGWALELLQQAISKEYSTHEVPIYLFADPSLTSLYHKAGFVTVAPDNQQDREDKDTTKGHEDDDLTMQNMPNSLRQRYVSISRRLKSKGARIHCFGKFHKQHDNPLASQSSTRMHLLFLQHHKERWRKTGTAALIQQAAEQESNLSSYLKVSNFTWMGRADNESLEHLLDDFQRNGRRVVLLWKGGTNNVTDFLHLDGYKSSLAYFCIDRRNLARSTNHFS